MKPFGSTASCRLQEEPPVKRRKTTAGLNSRFDRMMETVNILHTSPASSMSSRSGRRNRAASSSSASAADYELPRTPVDAYSQLHGGTLGAGFAVMKMRGRENSEDLSSIDSFARYAFDKTLFRKPPSIPAWLNNALSTLDTCHPLRRLIPVDSTSHEAAPAAKLGLPEERVNSECMPSHAVAKEILGDESIFAFNAPGSPATENIARASAPGPPASEDPAGGSDLGHDAIPGHVDFPSASPHCSPILDGSVSVASDPQLVPFSTPGPASCFSAVPPATCSLHSILQPHNLYPVSSGNAILPEEGGHTHYSHAVARIGGKASPGASISDHPAFLDAATRNAVGDLPGSPLDGDEDFERSAQLPGPEHIPGTHSAAPENYDYMRPFGGVIGQISSSSPTLDDMLPSMWQTVVNADLSPVQRTIQTHTQQDWGEGQNLPLTPVRFNTAPIRSIPARPVRIYFSSPAEDPCGSDVLEPDDYMLPDDLESLDFRWEKFDRGRVGEAPTSPYGTDLNLIPMPRALSALEELGQSVPRTPVLGTVHSSASSGIPALDEDSPEDDNDGTWIVPPAAVLSGATHLARGHRAVSEHTAESASRPLQPVFAPTPGIFISPLRKVRENNENPPPWPEVGLPGLF